MRRLSFTLTVEFLGDEEESLTDLTRLMKELRARGIRAVIEEPGSAGAAGVEVGAEPTKSVRLTAIVSGIHPDSEEFDSLVQAARNAADGTYSVIDNS